MMFTFYVYIYIHVHLCATNIDLDDAHCIAHILKDTNGPMGPDKEIWRPNFVTFHIRSIPKKSDLICQDDWDDSIVRYVAIF